MFLIFTTVFFYVLQFRYCVDGVNIYLCQIFQNSLIHTHIFNINNYYLYVWLCTYVNLCGPKYRYLLRPENGIPRNWMGRPYHTSIFSFMRIIYATLHNSYSMSFRGELKGQFESILIQLQLTSHTNASGGCHFAKPAL